MSEICMRNDKNITGALLIFIKYIVQTAVHEK